MSRPQSPPSFTFHLNATGGGGGGGSSPSLGSGASGSGQNNDQVTGSGTTNPGQHSTRRDQVNIEVARGRNYDVKTGHITVIPTTRIPRRLTLTSNSYLYHNDGDKNRYTFLIDVLLVPHSFNMETCFDLYRAQFVPQSDSSWCMGSRSPRNNIILLRRISVRGDYSTIKAKQWDVPDDIRNRKEDYQLVVTCPVLQIPDLSATSTFGLLLQLEMEF
ncbi:hypothetical protein BC827DRAFT_560315 [Russula dissimulans]|nr:hypothetical protein BC827DRAFT_560315 [Russula dissimulans]